MNMPASDQPVPAWDVRAYDYHLPRERIAQRPAPARDASRVLVYERRSRRIRHRVFSELPAVLSPGDLLVLNDSRVIPARLQAERVDTHTRIELLLTECVRGTTWSALVKPGKSCKPGVRLRVGDVCADVRDMRADGQRVIEFHCARNEFDALLATHGAMPLPPYIQRPEGRSTPEDRERYQTVYAARGAAVAAPTAGLHFTQSLLDTLETHGVELARVTLDVGPGTFLPVKSDDIRHHTMHSERFTLSADTAAALNHARAAQRRIIAIGTTSLRVLESCVDDQRRFHARAGSTDIFIHPPYRIRSIDGLLTNFHLPRSTLLMLVAAWVGADAWRRLYDAAIGENYRFYSYGDAMLAL